MSKYICPVCEEEVSVLYDETCFDCAEKLDDMQDEDSPRDTGPFP